MPLRTIEKEKRTRKRKKERERGGEEREMCVVREEKRREEKRREEKRCLGITLLSDLYL